MIFMGLVAKLAWKKVFRHLHIINAPYHSNL